MRLALEVVGAPAAAAGIEQGYARMYAAVARQMGVSMLELKNYALVTHMHGPTGSNTVQQRSGNLARSLTSVTEEDGTGVTGLVGVPEASTAPYARILHEGGTTRAHVIKVINAKALAFYSTGDLPGESRFRSSLGGTLTFRQRINHPGSKFPARPYLLSARDEQAAKIKADLTEAMVTA